MKLGVLIIWLIIGMKFSFAQDVDRLINKGNEAYRAQQYEKAAQAYKEALEKNPNNTTASFNMGNTLFKEKKFEEAAKIFEEAVKQTEEKGMQSQLYYNKGVSFTQQKKLDESITSYKQSLRINPADSLARDNLQRALNEKKQQQQQEQQKQDEQKQKKEDKPQPKQNKLNQKQVDQLLKALEEQEKKLQDKTMKKQQSNSQPEKDW